MSSTKSPAGSRPAVRFSRSGPSGNIYAVLGAATVCLQEHGAKTEAEEMQERVFSSGSYEEALSVIGKYVCLVEV